MAHIVDTVAGNRRIQLQGEEFVRPMSFGNNWQRIRVSICCQIAAFDSFTNAAFWIGFCNGTTNTVSSQTTTDFLGAAFNGVMPTGTLNYILNGGNPYVNLGSGQEVVFRKQNNSITSILFAGGNTPTFGAVGSTFNSFIGCDIIRSQNNPTSYTVAALLDLNTPLDRLSSFQVFAEAEGGVSGQGITQNSSPVYYSNTLTGGAVYDTVSVYWSRITPALEISKISVVRFY